MNRKERLRSNKIRRVKEERRTKEGLS